MGDTKKMAFPLNVEAIQLAFFLEKIDLSDRLTVAQKVIKDMNPIFNGTPTILPFPDDAPQEIPRIILSNENKSIGCNISANRIDFIYKVLKNDDVIDTTTSAFLTYANKISEVILTTLEAKSYRLGLVLNYRCVPTEGATDYLKKTLLKESKDKFVEVQIHKMNIIELNDFKTNFWIRFISDLQQSNSLLIISDINTDQNTKYDIDADKANKFIQLALNTSNNKMKEQFAL